METNTTKPYRRSNAEILADLKADKASPAKRKRRTKAEIERDNARAAKAKEEARLEALSWVSVVTFHEDITLFGTMWQAGDEMWVRPGSKYYELTHDTDGKFVLNKTPELQKKLWGNVRYTVREEPANGPDSA